MFKYPHGDLHGLNLDWFLEQWRKYKESFQNKFTASTTILAPTATPTVTVTYDDNTEDYDFNFGIPDTVQPTQTLIDYQKSASGTAVPTGTWTGTPPTVPQGQYLWTRNRVQYNNGYQYTSYCVSYMGIDGSKMHQYKSVTVNAGVNQQIIRLPSSGTDAKITTNTVLLDIQFAAPRRVISDLTWTSYAGYMVIEGTCTSATSAELIIAD